MNAERRRTLFALLLPLSAAACGDLPTDGPPRAAYYDAARAAVRAVPDPRTEFVAPGIHGTLAVDDARLRALVVDYDRRGHGRIEVSGSRRDVRIVSLALIRNGASVDSLDPEVSEGPRGVVVRFEAFRAAAPPCGAHDTDAVRYGALDSANAGSSDLGCVTESNFAAMLSDPMDLVRRRGTEQGVNASAAVGGVEAARTYVTPDKAQTQATDSTAASGSSQ